MTQPGRGCEPGGARETTIQGGGKGEGGRGALHPQSCTGVHSYEAGEAGALVPELSPTLSLGPLPLVRAGRTGSGDSGSALVSS